MAATFANLKEFVDLIVNIIKINIIPFLLTLATAVVLWGVIKYVLSSGSEENTKTARNIIIYGIIGLFVIVSMWGIVKILASTFGPLEGIPSPSL